MSKGQKSGEYSWLESEFGLTLSVPEIGQRYQIYDELGAGGAAQVYLGYDTDLARQVAIKILRRHRRASRDSVVRFLNEAKITARLQHPGIVPIHDIGIIQGELFIAMEKVEGRTLREILDERQPKSHQGRSLDELIRLFEHICQIVGYAHSIGVVHRDLKPANLMSGEFNKVYVMDWGLAMDSRRDSRLSDALDRYLAKGTAETAAGGDANRFAGTPAYMAPEQIVGMQGQVDPRSDVFALGVILYEMLAGKHPFERATMRETMHAIKNDPPPPIKASVNRDLKLVCAKALAKLPEKRYATAGELAEDIHRALNQYPVAARRNKVSAHVLKYGRRNWILACIVAAVTLAAVYFVTTRQRQEEEVTRWLSLAAERLRSAREHDEVADDLELRLHAAQASFRESLRRNLSIVRSREQADNIHARIYLSLAARRRGGELPGWATTWLQRLWFSDMERELELGDIEAATRLYHELADAVDVDKLFAGNPGELEQLRSIRRRLKQ